MSEKKRQVIHGVEAVPSPEELQEKLNKLLLKHESILTKEHQKDKELEEAEQKLAQLLEKKDKLNEKIAQKDKELEEAEAKLKEIEEKRKIENKDTLKQNSKAKQKKKEKKLANTKKTPENFFLDKRRKVMLAATIVGFGLFAFAGPKAEADGKNQKDKTEISNNKETKKVKKENKDDKDQEETKKINLEKISSLVQEKIDSSFYNEIETREAKIRYVSGIVKDIGLEKDSVSTKESDTSGVTEEDILSVVLKKNESGGDYLARSKKSTATGAYQFLAAWIKKIGLNPDSRHDLDSFRHSPELQEKLLSIAIPLIKDELKTMYPEDKSEDSRTKRFFAAYFVGEVGAAKYGTPQGDEIPPKNDISLNDCVNRRFAEYKELKNATKDGGQWIFDNRDEVVVDRNGDEHHWGTLYFVGSDYKKKYEIDFPALVKGDRNERYVSSVVHSKEETETVGMIVDTVDKQMNTLDEIEAYASK